MEDASWQTRASLTTCRDRLDRRECARIGPDPGSHEKALEGTDALTESCPYGLIVGIAVRLNLTKVRLLRGATAKSLLLEKYSTNR